MPERSNIRKQIDCLSSALLMRGGVENVVQTVYPCKCGVIWVPLAKVTLKVSRDLQLENASKQFLEVYPSKQRYLEDDSVTLLIPLEKVENTFDLLVDLLVKYLFLRYKLLQLMNGSSGFM